MTKELAIIIPYYKITYFEDTLKSLANQTNKNFNVYIGNDCSPQDPDLLIKKYSLDIPLVYEKFQINLGSQNLIEQWSRCIELSKNEPWLMILGDDDTLSHNFVDDFYNNLENINSQNIHLIRFASQNIDEKGNTISFLTKNPELEKSPNSYIRTLKGEGRSTLTEHIFSRNNYKKYGFKNFPVAFGSDNVAWLEFSELGNIYSINTAIAHIRISKQHLSSNPNFKLHIERHRGIYLSNKYILANYNKHFDLKNKRLILKKALTHLKYSRANRLTRYRYILFMISKIGIKNTYNLLNNR